MNALETKTFQILSATDRMAATAYAELVNMTPDQKRDRNLVGALTRIIDRAHIYNGKAGVEGYTIMAGRAIIAPDGSTYGPAAIKTATGSRVI